MAKIYRAVRVESAENKALVLANSLHYRWQEMTVSQRLLVRLFAIPCVLAGSICFAAAQQQPDSDSAKPNADNTGVNKSDRNKNEPTADQAKDNSSDREITQRIRKAIVSDKSLSTYAHNVKIISQGGKVTLKGPVHSEEEKKSIEEMATEVAGAGNVTNQITVKGDKAAKPAPSS